MDVKEEGRGGTIRRMHPLTQLCKPAVETLWRSCYRGLYAWRLSLPSGRSRQPWSDCPTLTGSWLPPTRHGLTRAGQSKRILDRSPDYFRRLPFCHRLRFQHQSIFPFAPPSLFDSCSNTAHPSTQLQDAVPANPRIVLGTPAPER